MNYCYNCNNWTDDPSGICPYCGAQTTPAQPQEPVQQPMYYQQPTQQSSYNKYIEQLANDILKWGIMSVAFACSFLASFMGIVFAAKANKKVQEYINYMGQVNGKAKVGKHLAKGGLIGGIVMTVFLGLYILYFVGIGILISQSF